LHLLLDEHRGREFDSLPAFFDARAQKESAEMLLHGARLMLNWLAISLLLHPAPQT